MVDYKVVIVIVALILFYFWSKNSSREHFYDQTSEGDFVLRNLYRSIHNLEAVTRLEVAQNNDFAGGNHGISKERLVMEHIARELSRLKGLARKEIAYRNMSRR